VTKGRWTAAISALAICATYAGLAAVSGHLSILARRPLLDSGLPVPPYNWIAPPPALAANNKQPASLTFTTPLTASGSKPKLAVTTDKQIIVVVSKSTAAAHGKDTEVKFSATPVDPSTLSPLASPNVVFGNDVKITATYEPSGDPVTVFGKPITVVLIYPATPNLTSTSHAIFTSTDGKTWAKQKSLDQLLGQSVSGPMPAPGSVGVGGIPEAGPSPIPTATQKGNSTTIIILAVALVALLIGVGFLLRSRGEPG
jgi:hypothetical protein